MNLKSFSFLALRALGYSPREAKRILDIARRSNLEFEDSINLCLECHGKAPLWAAPCVPHNSAFLRAPLKIWPKLGTLIANAHAHIN